MEWFQSIIYFKCFMLTVCLTMLLFPQLKLKFNNRATITGTGAAAPRPVQTRAGGQQTAAQLTAEQACEFRNLRETTRGQQGTWTQFRRGGWAGLGYRFWSRDKAGDPGMS